MNMIHAVGHQVDDLLGSVHNARLLHGVVPIAEALEGEADFYGVAMLDEAVELVKLRSRRYAKRQLSWLRRDGRVRWLDLDEVTPEGAAQAIVSELGGEPRASV